MGAEPFCGRCFLCGDQGPRCIYFVSLQLCCVGVGNRGALSCPGKHSGCRVFRNQGLCLNIGYVRPYPNLEAVSLLFFLPFLSLSLSLFPLLPHSLFDTAALPRLETFPLYFCPLFFSFFLFARLGPFTCASKLTPATSASVLTDGVVF